jgi:hypothetical protein
MAHQDGRESSALGKPKWWCTVSLIARDAGGMSLSAVERQRNTKRIAQTAKVPRPAFGVA